MVDKNLHNLRRLVHGISMSDMYEKVSLAINYVQRVYNNKEGYEKKEIVRKVILDALKVSNIDDVEREGIEIVFNQYFDIIVDMLVFGAKHKKLFRNFRNIGCRGCL